MLDTRAVEVRGLTKRYGSVTAIEDLSFSVPVGSVTGFLGPNGAGKTTTMRVLLGLAAPTRGEALVLDRTYSTLREPLRHVGASLEVTGFHPGRTARNHLRVVVVGARISRTRVDDVLALTGMTAYADRRVGGYSAGMRQRLALAAALLGDPEVLVLDEPANGLDPAGVAWLRGFLRRFADEGKAVLISSHILAEVAEVADRVVVLDRGHLITEGPVEALTAAGAVVVVRSPDGARLMAAVRAAGGSVVEQDGAFEVSGFPIEQVGELAAAHGVTLHELRTRASTLEDVFLSLTRGGDA
jgi:ABC-2 type transport system ATP-binding protein